VAVVVWCLLRWLSWCGCCGVAVVAVGVAIEVQLLWRVLACFGVLCVEAWL